MPNAPLQTMDFWRVASYRYPNPFRPEEKPQKAWAALRSFFDYDGQSYKALKDYWESDEAPRGLDAHATESWKQAFEEFGLLYVITRSDTITITPGGRQFFEAAEQKNERDFIWIGLNLILRYPLQGPPSPRRAKSPAHRNSDLLLYRFLYSAMRDLGDYFWWTELQRIFCRVFSTAEAKPAVEIVRQLRASPHRHTEYDLPTDKIEGAYYNSLNQVPLHAGLNHTVIVQDNDSEHYGANESRRRHSIHRPYLSLVSAALGDFSGVTGCGGGGSAQYVDRLPTAPSFDDEQEYFDYLGAEVPTLAATTAQAAPQSITIAGDQVFILKADEHFTQVSATALERVVQGAASVLCRVARSHRVIISTDMNWTYLVVEKNLTGSNTVRVSLRRAVPITNPDPIRQLLEGDNA
jgi:hypothetical protein